MTTLYWVDYCAAKKPLLLNAEQTAIYVELARICGLLARVTTAVP